ncbi:hypothetical protein GCM10010831_24740 [Psychroflexus salis]|uniref:Tissue inhibitor of metalloproteinase n=2 Tax=Psychroflexus salis TaxID=1526574 RepID=A0A917A1Y3_9FLAO|nr:hypothetical protein GCM10010831_24740 [Psychroflexus salis]
MRKPLPPIMKKILQITIFLFSIGTFACTCDNPKITEKFIESDFVAKARIIKNYKNENSRELYKADIIISELYKGEELKSIYVAGRSDGGIGSSCAIFIPENTELIVYARKNKDGKYSVGMCSGLLYLNKRNLKRQKRELEILKMFKSKNISFTDKINYREKATLHKKLEQFKGIELDKSYGIYEITFAQDLTIKNVTEISGFKNSIDEKLIEIIKTTEWTSFDKGVKDKVPENSKLLIGIYFYPNEKGNQSFLSQYYL